MANTRGIRVFVGRSARRASIVGALGWAALPGCRPVEEGRPATVAPQGPEENRAAVGNGDGVHSVGDESGAAPAEAHRPRPAPVASPVTDRARALVAVIRGNRLGAIEFMRKRLAEAPEDVEVRLALARALAEVGSLDDSLQVVRQAQGPGDNIELALLAARVLRDRGQVDAATAELERASAKDPDRLELQGELVALWADSGRRHETATKAGIERLYDAYDRGDAKTAGQLLAVAQAALARGTRGGFHDANMVLEQAEAAAPVDTGGWVGDRVRLLRGAMFSEKYAEQDAVATYDLILQRDPWNPLALVGKAAVHLDTLHFAAAATLAEEAMLVDAEQAEAQAILAQIALIEGRRDEARMRVVDHTLLRNPHHGRGLAVLAALAIVGGDTQAYAQARDRALATNPHNGAFFSELAEILGFLHLYPEADQVLREGLVAAPGDPYVQSAMGVNVLRLGDEAAGRAALQKAWKGDPFNQRTRNILDLYDKHLDVAYTVSEHHELTVRLPSEDREYVVDHIVETISRTRRDLDRLYGLSAGPLRLEFFASTQDFAVRTVGVPGLGAVAVCFGKVITSMGPYRGAFNLDLVLRHELAHVYAIRYSKGRVPRWFTEGLSEWESEQADPSWARESIAVLREAKRGGYLRHLSELELAFIRAETPQMMAAAYATAAYAMRYLGTNYGRDRLIEILKGYGRGEETSALFSKYLGKSLATVEREFEQWLGAQLAQGVQGWAPTNNESAKDPRNLRWRQALKLLKSGDEAAAAVELGRLVEDGGDGYAVRMALASLALKASTPQAARDHLLAAAKFRPESIEPIMQLASVAQQQGDGDGQKRWLWRVMAIDADALPPALTLFALATATGDTAASRYARARLQAVAPLHPASLAAQALAFVQAKEPERARRWLERATRPGTATALNSGNTLAVLAFAQAASGDQAAARVSAKAALSAGVPRVVAERLRGL